MKILTIAATPFFSDRGGHMRILNEAKYLQEMGAEVRLLTYHIGEDIPGLNIARVKGPKRYKKISPGFFWGKIWLDWKLLFLVRQEIRKSNPDAIHAHLWEGLAVGYLAKKMAFRGGIPIVFDLQGDLGAELKSYNRKNALARNFFVLFSKIVIRWADKIVVSSENVKINGKDLEIIRDGVDIDIFENPPELSKGEIEAIEAIKKWKGKGKLLAYIGGLSDNKGVGELLKYFSGMKNDWKLLLGGFGDNEEKYKKYIAENKLKDRMYFAGRVKYFFLPHYLALADAGIDPKSGSTESSGKIVNLMVAGLPIVCFDSEFNRARIGEKGLYLKDIRDLENILKKIETRGKIEYNLSELSEGKEARKLFEIFESLTR